MKRNLCIDGLNLLHRCRTGVNLGDFGIVYQFLRSLRSTINQFKPDNVYFVLEGNPKERKELLPEYKANRIIIKEDNPEQWNLQQNFFNQIQIAIGLLRCYLPINVIHHPRFEADDTIANLIYSDKDCEWTIISTDTDFIQLLKFDNVKLYNPIKKSFVEKPEYDYVVWKSLKGDSSDNISGFVGIGDKKAAKLALDFNKLNVFLNDGDNRSLFDKNKKLISFHEFSKDEWVEVISTKVSLKDWDKFRSDLIDLNFLSFKEDKNFNKFIDTFEKFW